MVNKDLRKRRLHTVLRMSVGYTDEIKNLQLENWDVEKPLVILTSNILQMLLRKYILGEINASELQYWAEFVELRDDIGYEEKNEDVLREVIFELATPEINRVLSLSLAEEFLGKFAKPS